MLPGQGVVLTFILVSHLWPVCYADVFSAMFKMEHLLATRQRVINDLDVYIHKKVNRLRDLKRYLKMYKAEHKRAKKDIINYMGNPINAFILINRLTSDLDDIEKRINKPTEFVSVRNIGMDDKNATYLYPTSVDLEGAALALKRLQKTYKLKVEDLANGVLSGVVYSDNRKVAVGLPMKASDCYKLGVIMLRKKDNLMALAWQMEALRKFKLEDRIPHSFTEIDILENMANLYYRLSDPDTALEWTMKILALDPQNELARKNVKVYEIQILKNSDESEPIVSDAEEPPNIDNTTEKSVNKETDDNEPDNNVKTDEKDISNEENEIDAGESNKKNKIDIEERSNTVGVAGTKNNDSSTISADANLKNGTDANGDTSLSIEPGVKNDTAAETDTNVKNNIDDEMERKILDEIIDLRKDIIIYEALCRGEYDIAPEISSRLTCHYKNDKPFLKLAPVKAEQRYIDPDVFLFYDVISDEEIAHVQKLAKPYINRAKVGHKENNSSAVADYRISQSSWIGDYEDDTKVVARLTQRIGDFTGLDMEYAEDLQVANYGVGGQYEPHFDYFGAEISEMKGDERIATAMFYMSDVTQGGATVFPKLGLTVFPVKGAAVFWKNLLPSGEGNQNTRHGACPVLEGSKWVSNKWIRILGQEFIKPCSLEYQREEVIVQRPPPVRRPEALVETNSW